MGDTGTTPYLLNLDGKSDLVVANHSSANVSILLNQPALAPAKPTILADQGGEQVVSSKDDSHSAFGCGSIDIKGNGPSGPGQAACLLLLFLLPFFLRLLQRMASLLLDNKSYLLYLYKKPF